MSKEVRKAIEEALLKFGECVRAGHVAALVALYTENARILPPNSEIIGGREAIEEFWGAMFGLGLKDAVLTTIDLVGEGDTVTEMGKAQVRFQQEGQEPIEYRDKYVVLWKRTEEGWKLHWDIWNSSLPTS